MDLQLKDRKAVVTGGSRGIGKATARALALEGCDVAIGARSEGPLREAAEELARETGRKIVPLVVDTINADSIKQFVEAAARELGGIQILINNAARVGGTPGTFENALDSDLMRDFEEKVVGYFRCGQACAPYMKQAGWGRIINISGGAARSPGASVSAGVRNIGSINLAKSMANSLGQYGITANAVIPGGTLTETGMERLQNNARQQGVSVESLLQQAAERSPVKHYPTAEDVANVITFLCSPLAISITGETISVMGGTSPEVHI